MAFYAISPWGDERADFRSGIIASTIANVNRGKRRKAFQPLDFMPFATKQDRPQAAAKRLSKQIRSIFAKLGGGGGERAG